MSLRSALLRRAAIAGLAAIALGCSTVPNREQSITVAPGLNESAVELAVIMAVLDTTKPPDMTIGQQITDNVLASVLQGYTSLRSRNAWYYEGREPGLVLAGFQSRGFYMRVAIHYTASQVTEKIVESRGLDQGPDQFHKDGEVIHKTAFRYLQTLDDRIRRSLGNVAQQKMIQELRAPEPTRKTTDKKQI